ncbi:MAG TPA: InlB B-repeat-containing protein, partial [Clostridia bacterium]|nr:InlB B-repeat-containing protein [Clostridia bacterium]
TYGTNSVITFYDAGAGIDTVTYTRDGGSSQSASLSYSADRKTATFSTNIGGAYNFTITDNVGRTAYDSRTIPRRFQIAFNGNGATSGSMSNMQCLTERSYTLTANAFSRTGGYSFAGWNTAADGSGTNYSNQQQINFNFTTVTSDNMTITLYAKWMFTYTLTYNANTSPGTSSVSGTVPSNQIVTNGSAYTIGGSLSRNGYRFLGWSRTSGYVAHDGSWSANGTSRFLASTQYSLMVEGATPGATLTLYAVWQYNSYTVTYGANKPSAARSSVTGSMANTLHVYDTAQNLRSNAYALAGYTFLGWSTNAVTTAVQNLTDAGGTTYTNSQSVNNILTGHGGTYNLYAVWRANTYQIQVNYGGSTSGSVTVNGTTIANGASTSAIASDVTVTLARTLARTGYNFVGW